MELVVIVPLFLLIYSDFRNKWIRSVHLLVFACLQLLLGWWRGGYETVCFGIVWNCLVLILWGGGVLLFYAIRHGGMPFPLKEKIGLGDLYFLLCLTPVFEVAEFVGFLFAGFLMSLVYGWFSSWVTGREQTIPLVGTVGGCYVVLLLKNLIVCHV